MMKIMNEDDYYHTLIKLTKKISQKGKSYPPSLSTKYYYDDILQNVNTTLFEHWASPYGDILISWFYFAAGHERNINKIKGHYQAKKSFRIILIFDNKVIFSGDYYEYQFSLYHYNSHTMKEWENIIVDVPELTKICLMFF